MRKPLPQAVGPYRVLRALGQGGMGVVLEVQDPAAPRSLALKLILRGAASPLATRRFLREADLLSRVHHRNVIRVHQLGESEHGHYLVTELIDGRDLSEILDSGEPLAPLEAARIVAQVASAIEAIHQAGVLYRDLKPANVMLRSDGIPILLDFGLARDDDAERLTKTGVLVGTPAYMAPEVARGVSTGELGPEVDTYGLGAVLYELLCGAPPFSGDSLAHVLARILNAEPDPLREARPQVPVELERICLRALAKDPIDRYRTAAALRDDLERFVHRETAAAGRTKRWALFGVAGLALSGTALAAAAALSPPSVNAPPPPPKSAPSAPAPTEPLEAHLWSSTETQFRGQVDFEEENTETMCMFHAAFDVEVSEERPVCDLRFTMRRIKFRSGVSALGGGSTWDSQGFDPQGPLAPLGTLVGASFTARLDARTGALTDLQGLDAAHQRVIAMGLEPVGGRPEAFKHILRTILSNRFFEERLRASFQVLGAAYPWSRRDAPNDVTRFRLKGFEIEPGLPVPLDPERRRFSLRGETEFRDGYPRAAVLHQDRVMPLGDSYRSSSEWRVTLEAAPPGE